MWLVSGVTGFGLSGRCFNPKMPESFAHLLEIKSDTPPPKFESGYASLRDP